MAFGFGFALTAIAKAVGFTPRSLFTSGAQGAWYDPSDYSTMFEDAAGTIPITSPLEKPVGLMLDKSKGLVLGPELVTNGDFSNGTTGWTAVNCNTAVSSSGVKITPTGIPGTFSQSFSTVIGKTYKVTGSITSVTGTGGGFYAIRKADNGGSPSSNIVTILSSVGAASGYFTATATTSYITLQVNWEDATFDNISVKEVLGNHAYQSTTTSRPTLSARYNLLTYTEDITPRSGAWTHSNIMSYSNQGGGVMRIETAGSGTESYVSAQTAVVSVGMALATRVQVRAVTYSGNLNIDLQEATSPFPATTQTITLTADWKTVEVSRTLATAGVTAAYLRLRKGSATVGGTFEIRFPEVQQSAIASLPYQQVNTSTDFAVDGFPAAEVFDGTDDSQITAAGGGSTTAFFWCSSIRVGKVGAVQTLFSDTGTNTGYRVRINASNQLELAAGNNTTYITATTSDVLTLGQRAVLTAWHDGANLNVQINNGTVVQTAFATATAGTAQITIGKDNNAASSYFMGRLYEKVYLKDTVLSAASIASTKAYCAQKAKVTL